ncbi:MAG TPA: winged helix-turn-helix domain-containing protein [Vicinamibacteria bacterium]|nr:winged helix-turn-helix domain-containing protein [Vicinamibacteria bacterium]
MVSDEIRAFGKFRFHPETGELFAGDKRIEIQHQPARVLAILTGRPGTLVSRDEIRRALWGNGTFVDFDRNLNYCVRRIRVALGDSPRSPGFVQTIPKRGYRFLAPVAVVEERQKPRFRTRGSSWRLTLAGATFVLGLVGGAMTGELYASSPLHRRVVDWLHQRLSIPAEGCPWSEEKS